MSSPEEQKGAKAPQGEAAPAAPAESGSAESTPAATETGYTYPEDPYSYETDPAVSAPAEPAPPPAPSAPAGNGASGGPPPPKDPDPEDADEDGMLRMSFLDHLQELRSRIIRALMGIGIAFALSLTFTNKLWLIVSAPATDALTKLGVKPPNLSQITPMEVFNTIWVKLPILTAIFLASPWVLYQVWAFIAPGLYKRERKWAAPFVIFSAGLFIAGGLFAYFVAFRFGLVFLLGIGRDVNITPMVSVTEYFDLFVNVTLGVGIVFELPVLIFFLTLLHIVTPRFLITHSRYAILIIVILAAIITPTPDIFNLMLFATPMCLLYFVGVFASYILVLRRQEKAFPWAKVLLVVLIMAGLAAGIVYLAVTRYGYHLVQKWPFLIR